MLEQIIRPFQTAPVLATRRIVKSVPAVAVAQKAILPWGAAGTIPAGVQQAAPPKAGTGLLNPGFSVKNARQVWSQSGTPVTEEVDVGGVKVKRVREIVFETIDQATPVSSGIGFAAAAVSDVVSGLLIEMSGSRATKATYKTKWD